MRAVTRRSALGLGAVATARVAVATLSQGTATAAAPTAAAPTAAASTANTAATAVDAPESAAASTPAAAPRVRTVYERESRRAGGVWNAFISLAAADGTPSTAVDEGADELVEAFSVNKLGVAAAVLTKVDRGELRLDQRVEVTADIVVPGGDGIFGLDGAYPSEVTLGHALAALLTISDDTSVRLCGLVAPAAEINSILQTKGFPKTQVTPVANPNRFFLGKTTPRETHDLLQALVRGSLLSPASTSVMLNNLRSPIAFTDGIRLQLSTAERARIATKAGWFNDGRNEAGVIFDGAGAPALTYSLFAHGQADPDNFVATHPAIRARAIMGRRWLDILGRLDGAQSMRHPARAYRPWNGN
jgi:beta-lactamase class A